LTHFANPNFPASRAHEAFGALKTAPSGASLARAIDGHDHLVGSVLNLIYQSESLFQGAPLKVANSAVTRGERSQ
jgi:hypothetical protein